MVRNDYVSNSSSCSFIVNELESCDIDELKKLLGVESPEKNPRNISSITFISRSGFSDDTVCMFYDICDPDYDWNMDEYIRYGLSFDIQYHGELTKGDIESGILDYFKYKDIIFTDKLLKETDAIMIDLGDTCDIYFDDFKKVVDLFKEHRFHVMASDDSHYQLPDAEMYKYREEK